MYNITLLSFLKDLGEQTEELELLQLNMINLHGEKTSKQIYVYIYIYTDTRAHTHARLHIINYIIWYSPQIIINK